jgi:hypothetical protein
LAEGVEQHEETSLEKGEGISLNCKNAGIQVLFILEKERGKVCVVDVSRALGADQL